jgi:hypothetical protein
MSLRPLYSGVDDEKDSDSINIISVNRLHEAASNNYKSGGINRLKSEAERNHSESIFWNVAAVVATGILLICIKIFTNGIKKVEEMKKVAQDQQTDIMLLKKVAIDLHEGQEGLAADLSALAGEQNGLQAKQNELNKLQYEHRCLKYELKKLKDRIDAAFFGALAEEDLNDS